jgi:hypothetical protein
LKKYPKFKKLFTVVHQAEDDGAPIHNKEENEDKFRKETKRYVICLK